MYSPKTDPVLYSGLRHDYIAAIDRDDCARAAKAERRLCAIWGPEAASNILLEVIQEGEIENAAERVLRGERGLG